MIRSLLGRDWFCWTLFGVFAGVAVLLGGWNMPLAWDDGLQANYGRLVLNYFLSGGADKGYEEFINLKYYGATFEVLSAVVHRLLGDDLYAFRAFLIGAVSMLGGAWTILLGKRLGLGRWAWLAGLLLLLHPQFWGQAFVNSKDIPMLTATVGWWLAYLRWADSGFRWNGKWLVACLALGLLLSIRVMALVAVPGPLLVGFLGWWRERPAKERSAPGTLLRAYPWLSHLAIFPVAWVVMIACWPFALENPLTGPFQAVHHFLTFPFKMMVEVAGEVYSSHELPRYTILLEHFLAQPLVWVFLLLVGLGRTCRMAWAREDSALRLLASVALWVAPLQILFLLHPGVTYHGVRHTLFLWPAYALLAAAGARAVIVWIRRGPATTRRWIPAMLLALILVHVLRLIAWHPYAYVYRNPVTQLFPGGYTGFSGDYHGLSVKAALREVLIDSYPWRADSLVLTDLWAVSLFRRYTGERVTVSAYPQEFLDRGKPASSYQYFVLLEWFVDGRISPWLNDSLFSSFPLEEPFATISVEGIPLAYVYRLFEVDEVAEAAR